MYTMKLCLWKPSLTVLQLFTYFILCCLVRWVKTRCGGVLRTYQLNMNEWSVQRHIAMFLNVSKSTLSMFDRSLVHTRLSTFPKYINSFWSEAEKVSILTKRQNIIFCRCTTYIEIIPQFTAFRTDTNGTNSWAKHGRLDFEYKGRWMLVVRTIQPHYIGHNERNCQICVPVVLFNRKQTNPTANQSTTEDKLPTC